MSSNFDIAQICLNGHVVNSMTEKYPEDSQDFWEKCGSKTISKCSDCNSSIRGFESEEDGFPVGFDLPFYCIGCGEPYPWTKSRIQAALTIFADEISDEAELKEIENGIHALAGETPQAAVATTRFPKWIGKLGKRSADAVQAIVVDIISETARKTIYPDGG